MGRKKIDIKERESKSERKNTFKKRSEGIKKKAKELSIISDAQVLLLFGTPNGKYDIFHAENSSFDGIVQRFLSETQENLEDSRSEGMKTLRSWRSFKSDVHAQNALSLMDHGTCPTDKKKDTLEMELKHIKMEVSKLETQLGSLRNIDEIEKLEQFDELDTMENSIMELLAMVNGQQARVDSTAMYNSGDKRCSTISAAGPNSDAASQSRVPQSLAQDKNPPIPLISTNNCTVNAGFNRCFHAMLEMNTPAPPPPIFTDPHPYNDWTPGAANPGQVIQEPPLSVCTGDPGAYTHWQLPMNPPLLLTQWELPYQVDDGWAAQQYFPAMANDYEAGPSHC